MLGVTFEYKEIYLNKKGKACKARVNEWISNPNIGAPKRCQRCFHCGFSETFPKRATIFLTSPTFPLFYSCLDCLERNVRQARRKCRDIFCLFVMSFNFVERLVNEWSIGPWRCSKVCQRNYRIEVSCRERSSRLHEFTNGVMFGLRSYRSIKIIGFRKGVSVSWYRLKSPFSLLVE